jgi:poly(hydroxyalkanoate) depolymerase family esterase
VLFPDFGPNPGRLRMLVHQPAGATRPGQPLVVVLHGCGQDAAAFARASGWVAWAERKGVPLVLPEQMRENNRGRCFHWFKPADTGRDQGEAGSIAAMTRSALAHFGSDPDRVFIVGLSAGGAMAAAMLAAYPDLFAGGAVVAGLPVGSAASSVQALLRMAKAGDDQAPDAWIERIGLATGTTPTHRSAGHWPRLSVWHGEADTTVDPVNAIHLVAQWRALHNLPADPIIDSKAGGARHRVWGDAVELWTLPDMAHGYPVGLSGQGDDHMLPSLTPATPRIARFWGVD